MTRQLKSGDRQMKAFRDSLTKVLGPDNVPPEAIGDLSDLLDTLRQGEHLLTELMALGKSLDGTAAVKLHQLEILLADDLRMISKDLLPNLKKMRKTAYSIGTKRKERRSVKKRPIEGS